MQKYWFGILCAAFLLNAGTVSASERPREVFEEKERVIASILQDQTLDERVRREKLISEMRGSFDYQELARRSLAGHWDGLNAKQRAEFTSILKELIEHSIISKVKPVQDFSAEVVQEIIKGTQATIASAISTKTSAEPVRIEFQMTTDKSRGWVVYDMIIDEVSLLTSYRQQFAKIIRAESFDALMSKMMQRLQKTRQQVSSS